jgi:hypothetical protein
MALPVATALHACSPPRCSHPRLRARRARAVVQTSTCVCWRRRCKRARPGACAARERPWASRDRCAAGRCGPPTAACVARGCRQRPAPQTRMRMRTHMHMHMHMHMHTSAPVCMRPTCPRHAAGHAADARARDGGVGHIRPSKGSAAHSGRGGTRPQRKQRQRWWRGHAGAGAGCVRPGRLQRQHG